MANNILKILYKILILHNYCTRFVSRLSLSLPKARTNYGKFNIRFAGARAWNSVDEKIKLASSISQFKFIIIFFLSL